MPVIVTDNKLCYSVYHTESKILHSTYSGLVNNKANQILFQEHLANGIEFAKENEIRGIIVDIRKLRGSYVKYFDYLESTGYPALKKSGFTHEAIVVSDDLIIANVSRKLVDILTRLRVEARIFTGLREAETWLTKQVK